MISKVNSIKKKFKQSLVLRVFDKKMKVITKFNYFLIINILINK